MGSEYLTDALITSTEEAPGKRILTLGRPDKANVLNADIVERLHHWVDISCSDGCRTLMICGSGRTFCGGFDFTGYSDASCGDLLYRFVRLEELFQKLRGGPFVSNALIQGPAIGAGADLAAACTYRIGGPKARFAFPGFRFGVALGTRHLASLVGPQSARDILLRNRTLDADEALRIGLLTHRVADDALLQTARELASDAKALDLVAQRRIIELTVSSQNDSDLAQLVRSVSAPGIHKRIGAYRAEHARS